MLARPIRMSSHVRPVMRDDLSYSRDQSISSHLVSMTSLAAVSRQPALDVRGRGPVASALASVNKQYWSVLGLLLLLLLSGAQRLSPPASRFHRLDHEDAAAKRRATGRARSKVHRPYQSS